MYIRNEQIDPVQFAALGSYQLNADEETTVKVDEVVKVEEDGVNLVATDASSGFKEYFQIV